MPLAIFCESGVKSMANIKSAKKRIKVINRKNAENIYKALAAKDFDTAKEKLVLAEKKLMQAAAKNTIHKNAASRKVSRMNLAYNKAKAE